DWSSDVCSSDLSSRCPMSEPHRGSARSASGSGLRARRVPPSIPHRGSELSPREGGGRDLQRLAEGLHGVSCRHSLVHRTSPHLCARTITRLCGIAKPATFPAAVHDRSHICARRPLSEGEHMTTATENGSPSAPDTDSRTARRATAAAFAGAFIEWYDFYLYGTAAALVFPRIFFPEADPTVALLQS